MKKKKHRHAEDVARIERVHWRDANFTADVATAEDWAGDFINCTVGWVKEDGDWLIIVGEITPGGEKCVTRVPMVNVTERTRLRAE